MLRIFIKYKFLNDLWFFLINQRKLQCCVCKFLTDHFFSTNRTNSLKQVFLTRGARTHWGENCFYEVWGCKIQIEKMKNLAKSANEDLYLQYSPDSEDQWGCKNWMVILMGCSKWNCLRTTGLFWKSVLRHSAYMATPSKLWSLNA